MASEPPKQIWRVSWTLKNGFDRVEWYADEQDAEWLARHHKEHGFPEITIRLYELKQ